MTRKSTYNTSKWVNHYRSQRPINEKFTNNLKSLIESILLKEGIKFYNIECRTKTISSFKDKITRLGKNYSDPLNEITDLSGLRIILYYIEDIKLVCKILEQEFKIDKSSSLDKSTLLKPNEFGYLSTHYIISLDDKRKNLSEWKDYSNLMAEVQIRTILQHAWASISHALQYKRKEDVPVISRRRLYRLSGIFELADEEFCRIRKEQINISRKAIKDIKKAVKGLELNLLTLKEFFNQYKLIKDVVRLATQIGFKFDKEDAYISQCLKFCNNREIKTIDKLESIVAIISSDWAIFLKNVYIEVSEKNSYQWTVTISFLILLLLVRHFHDELTSDELFEYGFSDNIIKILLKIIDQTDRPGSVPLSG